MLFLTRKVGEAIKIDDNITLTITQIRGNQVKISFDYPKEVRILRKEVFDKIQSENQIAAASSHLLTQLIQNNQKKVDGAYFTRPTDSE